MGQDNHAQIAQRCDQVYDQEDSEERCLQPRVVCDPHENKFSHLAHSSMIVFFHVVLLGNLC